MVKSMKRQVVEESHKLDCQVNGPCSGECHEGTKVWCCCLCHLYYSFQHLSSVCVGRHLDLCGRALQTEKADPLDHSRDWRIYVYSSQTSHWNHCRCHLLPLATNLGSWCCINWAPWETNLSIQHPASHSLKVKICMLLWRFSYFSCLFQLFLMSLWIGSLMSAINFDLLTFPLMNCFLFFTLLLLSNNKLVLWWINLYYRLVSLGILRKVYCHKSFPDGDQITHNYNIIFGVNC